MVTEDPGDARSLSKFDHCTLQQLRLARHDLTQNLCSLSQIKGRLHVSDSKIQGLDQRLPLLQSVMDSLDRKASVENALTARIDLALSKASSLLQIFKEIHLTEKKLSYHDPRTDLRKYLAMVCSLERYIETLQQSYGPSLDWLEQVVGFLSQAQVLDKYSLSKLANELAQARDVDPRTDILYKPNGRLLNKALTKLEDEFCRLLVENSCALNLSDCMSKGDAASPQELLSSDILHKLLVITHRLKVNGRVEGCFRMFKEARIQAMNWSMAGLNAKYLHLTSAEAVERVEWEEVHDHIYSWVMHVKVIFKVLLTKERDLCGQLFETVGLGEWKACFGEMLQDSNLGRLFEYGSAVACSQHRPEALLVGLLDMFKGMEEIKGEQNLWCEDGHGAHMAGLLGLRRVLVQNVSRSFWQFAQNVSMCHTQGPLDGGKDHSTSFVVNYMGMLARDYKMPMDTALHLVQQQCKADASMQANLSGAAHSIMETLEKNLVDRSKSYTDTALGHVFLMNNMRHVLVRLKECTALADMLGDEWRMGWKRKVDNNLRLFLKHGWEGVITHLNREGLHSSSGGRGASRDLLRSRLQAFNQAFEEAHRKQSTWTIFDPSLKASVQINIEQLVVPTYHSFLASFAPSLEDGSLRFHRKIIEYTDEMLQAMIGDLFEGRQAQPMHLNKEDNHSY